MTRLSSPSLQLLTAIWNLWQSLAADGDTRLRVDCGVDLKGFIALGHLQVRPYQPAELAAAMQMPRYEVSRLLGTLEASGLISRVRNGRDGNGRDGRQVTVNLTPEGQQAWDRGLNTVEDVTAPCLAGLDPASLDHLIQTLTKLFPAPQGEPT